jgi:hypothetical protein
MLAQLLDQARRRVLAQLALDKGALSLTIGMGGLILLLLTGTQILDWYWPFLLIVVSLGVGLARIRQRLPSRYRLAQRIDRSAALADALSTAVYFGEHPREGAQAVCRLQYSEADSMAAGVDLKTALPYHRSRYLAPAAGLLLVAAGLFAVRYAVTGTLDLQPSLIGMAIDTFFESPAEETSQPPLRAAARPEFFDPANPNAPPPLEQQTQIPVESKESSELSQGDAAEDSKDAGKEDLSDQNKDGQGEQEPADDSKGRDPNTRQDGKDEGKEGGQDDAQENRQEERSMLDKLRDAVSNLMNKMNSNNSQKNQPQNSKRQQASQDKQQSGEKGDDQAERAEGQPQTDQNQKGDQSDKQQAEAQQSPGERPSEEAASGAGTQDGEKRAEQARLLEAMGKVSQLLGQRSLEVSGQVMVEVGNTKQGLKTQWTQQNAGHGEAGREIHRDEIPLMYQPFIERYFEEVRKTATPAARKPGN